MVVRYYWGLGVGHAYAHKSAAPPPPINTVGVDNLEDDLQELEESALPRSLLHPDLLYEDGGGRESEDELEDPELSMEDREDEGWSDSDSSGGYEMAEESDTDSIFVEMSDMYGLA